MLFPSCRCLGWRHLRGAVACVSSCSSGLVPFLHHRHHQKQQQHYQRCSHFCFTSTSIFLSPSSSPPVGAVTAPSSTLRVFRCLHDCRKRVRTLLRELSGVHRPDVPYAHAGDEGNSGEALAAAGSRGGARTLLELHELAEQFLGALHATVLLPRDVVHEVDDFPLFLLDCFRRSGGGGGQMTEERHLLGEEEIVGGFIDWMDTTLPATSLAGVEQYVSFVELMQLVESYVRYHRGVRWGGGETKKEWYRSGYLLHPWHDTYCPASRAEQMPYVHLLQWLLRTKPPGGTTKQHTRDRGGDNAAAPLSSSQDDAMLAWHATEPFSPPSWHSGPNGFSALDCGCHSGYMTELLMKAGARQVVGVDVTMQALGSSEATFRDHMQQRRSASHAKRVVHFVRCDVLPEGRVLVAERKQSSPNKGSVLASAAAHRRRAARQHSMPDNPEEAVSAESEISSFDLLVFHPPIRPLFPTWSLLQDSAGWLDSPALDAGCCHPHCHLPALRELLQRLVVPPAPPSESNSGGLRGLQRVAPLVKYGGYAAFILPRTFDMRCMLQCISSSLSSLSVPLSDGAGIAPAMSLCDVVTAALEGSYELVLKRRHSFEGMLDPAEAVHRRDMAYLRAFAHPRWHENIKRELNLFYRMQLAVDLVVFRRKDKGSITHRGEKSGGSGDTTRSSGCNGNEVVEEEPLAFEETFEYTEYLPADGPALMHHWTEMTPSFSYLEDDFFSKDGSSATAALRERNFLAVGHTIPTNTRPRQLQPQVEGGEWSPANLHAVQRNLLNYRSLFTADLKGKRNGRVRKVALQPLAKQEWYIDEKLIKSESAKIDLLNDLSRFDLQDWD